MLYLTRKLDPPPAGKLVIRTYSPGAIEELGGKLKSTPPCRRQVFVEWAGSKRSTGVEPIFSSSIYSSAPSTRTFVPTCPKGWYMISLITIGPTFGYALLDPVPVRNSASEPGESAPNVRRL